MRRKVSEIIKNIQIIFFDFDGVFTDDKVIINEQGIESIRCSRSDGIGLRQLEDIGVKTVILSSEVNNVVKIRANKLQIECFNGVKNKKEFLLNYINNIYDIHNVAFLGNDINDNACLEIVGLPVVVKNANIECKKRAKIVLKRKGGDGAVRELCELIVNIKK